MLLISYEKTAFTRPRSTELNTQAQEFNLVIEEQMPVSDSGIVENIEEVKELLVENKNELVHEERDSLTTDELKELIGPDSPVGVPEVIS